MTAASVKEVEEPVVGSVWVKMEKIEEPCASLLRRNRQSLRHHPHRGA